MTATIGAPAEAGGGGVAAAVAHSIEAVVAPPAPLIVPANRGFTDAQRDEIEKMRPEIHKKIRDSLLPANTPLNAKVLSLAACDDNEVAADGPNHGKFTQALLDVFTTGGFENYQEFIDKINAKVNSPIQHPTLRPRTPDESFVKQQPFTLSPP